MRQILKLLVWLAPLSLWGVLPQIGPERPAPPAPPAPAGRPPADPAFRQREREWARQMEAEFSELQERFRLLEADQRRLEQQGRWPPPLPAPPPMTPRQPPAGP
jgi:hypothetical protein